MKKKVYLSRLTRAPLINYLSSQHYNLEFVSGDGSPVYREISTHADLYMCQLGLGESARIFKGNMQKLKKYYPGNIRYNAVCTGKYFIHNLKYTDAALLQAARQWQARYFPNTDFEMVHVSQGYTRCCCLPVNDDSFITADIGIAKALSARGARILLIEEGYISLPGFDYGFIGGCAGNLVKSGIPTIVFHGNLADHPQYKEIAIFLKDRDVKLIHFDAHPLEDIGSILTGAPLQEPPCR